MPIIDKLKGNMSPLRKVFYAEFFLKTPIDFQRVVTL